MNAVAPGRRRRRTAAALIGALVIAAFAAPLVANERPLLALVGGRLTAPAAADLPLVGALFDGPAARAAAGTPPGERVLLRAPVPYSYRGIRLDESLLPPDRRHLLGTDTLGRDLLARLIHGMRASLLVGFGASGFAVLLGLLLGGAAGIRGGWTDAVVTRLTDTVACFPPFVLALAFVAASGRGGLAPLVLAIALQRWTGTARYVRGEILKQRGGEVWIAARAAGATGARLLVRHLLPLMAAPLLVVAAFGAAHAIVLESGLSFLGFGVAPPTPSWGAMLAESRGVVDAAWWPVAFPAAALMLLLALLCLVAETFAGESERGAA